MIDEATIDKWSQIRNLIGLVLIAAGTAGLIAVFLMAWKLFQGIPNSSGLFSEIQKVLSGDSALFIQIAAETGVKKIELAPAFASLVGLIFYVMVLGIMGGLAQGALSSGLELMQADIRKLKYSFESKNSNNQTPST